MFEGIVRTNKKYTILAKRSYHAPVATYLLRYFEKQVRKYSKKRFSKQTAHINVDYMMETITAHIAI
jgi:hypothetical protein